MICIIIIDAAEEITGISLSYFKSCDANNNYELSIEETAECDLFATDTAFNDADADGNDLVSSSELLSVKLEELRNGRE